MLLIASALAALCAAIGGYVLVVRGVLILDLNVGRRVRPLGPISHTLAAPPDTVFDVIAGPYLGRTPRAINDKDDKLRVLERGSDMVLAAHFTQTGRLTTTTVETVRFERPDRISFRVLRSPVPHFLERLQTGRAPSLAQLKGEHARLDEEITRLERDDRESRQPVGITGC